MASRITDKQLDAMCDRINRATGSPLVPWARNADGRNVAQIGNYHISHAYGGVCLHRMHNAGGGVSSPLYSGHIPKRELYDQMFAFLMGIESTKN
jgi:hypothetical protein